MRLLEKVINKENHLQYHKDETGRLPEKPHYKHEELDAMAQKIILEASDILGDKVVYRSDVYVEQTPWGHKFIKTYADKTSKNNLDNLPEHR